MSVIVVASMVENSLKKMAGENYPRIMKLMLGVNKIILRVDDGGLVLVEMWSFGVGLICYKGIILC